MGRANYVHLFGPPQKQLASKRFETDTDVKQAVTSYGCRHLTPVSSMP